MPTKRLDSTEGASKLAPATPSPVQSSWLCGLGQILTTLFLFSFAQNRYNNAAAGQVPQGTDSEVKVSAGECSGTQHLLGRAREAGLS